MIFSVHFSALRLWGKKIEKAATPEEKKKLQDRMAKIGVLHTTMDLYTAPHPADDKRIGNAQDLSRYSPENIARIRHHYLNALHWKHCLAQSQAGGNAKPLSDRSWATHFADTGDDKNSPMQVGISNNWGVQINKVNLSVITIMTENTSPQG